MNNFHKIFQKLDHPHPPQGLEERILQRIETLETDRLKRAILITRFGRVLSIVAFLSVGFIFGQSVIASDFWQIASLLFSDANIVMNYFSEFLYSLLETLPALPIALILMPLFSFFLFQFWSLSIDALPRRSPLASFRVA